MCTALTHSVTAAEEIIFPETRECLNHSPRKKKKKKEKYPIRVFFFLYIAIAPFQP
jgi:hypothetical protein